MQKQQRGCVGAARGRSAAFVEKPIRSLGPGARRFGRRIAGSSDEGVCLLTFRFWGDGGGPGKGV
jgi:hypothetical protein